MHIKKLEICGFKSFVDRTVIHFDHDMIGVVGPNGCGKSNVVDAIRWVMGEQSAKALRGKGMSDVIFNGSETRAQAGFAEVTITFDNGDPAMAQSLPLEYRDYADISVTRRLYRGDGSNDYFINKVPVRLRDVTEVFLGTGVGRKAYSIVEQGKIGLIVSARAEDRRILIEEAAGITKYKARKRQAENKMALTRQNLTRVNDIVSEIERQLGNLRRQAAKAERYVRYREELDDLMLWEASHKLLELIAVIEVAKAQVATTDEKATRRRAAVEERDAELEVMRHEAKTAESAAERAQNQAFFSDNEVREQETRIERAGDRFGHLDRRLGQAREEQRSLEAKAGSLSGERAALREQREVIADEQAREQELLQGEADALEALRLEAQRADGRLVELRRGEAAAAEAIARGEAALAALTQRGGEIEQRGGRLELELARLEGEHAGLARKHHELGDRVQQLAEKKQALCDARDALKAEHPALRDQAAACDKELEKERHALQRNESRLRALEELEQRMEGLGQGVRNLLATGDDALVGIVADRIEVPAEITAAFAGLVGDRLQCVVVEDLDRALELLRGLAQDRRGRATVIARGVAPSLDGASFEEPGALHLGRVVDRLGYAPEDRAVVQALVGDAVLVRSDEDARRLRSEIRADLVTLEGTVFHADGRVTGGAGDAFAAGMLEQKREMRELAAQVEVQRAAVAERTAEMEALRERLAELQESLDQAKSEAHGAEIALVTGSQDLQRLEQQLALVARRRDEVAAEVGELDDARLAAARQRDETTATLEAARATRTEAATALSEAEAAAQSAHEALAAQQSAFTERKVQLASINERVHALTSALERIEREHDELSRRIADLEREREQAADEAGALAAEMFLAREALVEARRRARSAQMEFENARLGLDDARHALALRETELREMRTELDGLGRALNEQQMLLQRQELEREHLEEAIAERFRGLELRTVVGDYHARPLVSADERARIKELSRLIDRMGSVNLDAMREFEESSERFTYYSEQKLDLEKALGDLETAIEQMNKESTRLFRHAFEGINRRFKEIFPKMFRGGKAELRLSNPDDLLESGIEILAQPPGKRLGNLELMSGGEKAFTAVSLLLSIFRYKPSPFCILDEVDAPLDDANIGRYVEALRAMTDRSQFIIITHSKRTMEAVDVLYGVTMQEAGVSKLVGVRVGDNEARSNKKRESAPAPAEPVEQDSAVA